MENIGWNRGIASIHLLHGSLRERYSGIGHVARKAVTMVVIGWRMVSVMMTHIHLEHGPFKEYAIDKEIAYTDLPCTSTYACLSMPLHQYCDLRKHLRGHLASIICKITAVKEHF